MSFVWLDEGEAARLKPAVILLDGRNQVIR